MLGGIRKVGGGAVSWVAANPVATAIAIVLLVVALVALFLYDRAYWPFRGGLLKAADRGVSRPSAGDEKSIPELVAKINGAGK
jgi:hypothetical protein